MSDLSEGKSCKERNPLEASPTDAAMVQALCLILRDCLVVESLHLCTRHRDHTLPVQCILDGLGHHRKGSPLMCRFQCLLFQPLHIQKRRVKYDRQSLHF